MATLGRRPDLQREMGMRRLLSSLFTALFWIAAAAGSHAQQSDPVGRAVVAVAPGNRVNVRAAPEVRSGNIVGKAVGGQLVEILGSERRGMHVWYRVRDPEGRFSGWIRGDLLKIEPVPIEPPEQVTLPSGEPPAEPDTPSAKRRPMFDWSKGLPEMMPAIRGCAEASSARPVVVLIARKLSFGVVDIVLRDSADRIWRCVGSERGGTPMQYDPLGEAQVELLGTPNPEFYFEAEPPPADDCHELEPVRDPQSGAPLGILRYDICS